MRLESSASLIILLLSACATSRTVAPTITSTPRTALSLQTPVLGAVTDGRVSQGHEDAASQLKADLTKLYGSSIEWADYYAKTPPGRVAVRIRIVTLDAIFGSRLISSTSFATAVGSAQIAAGGPWGPVVGTVSSQQSLMATTVSGEGWWNGGAWVDLEVEDFRGSNPVTFVLPIVAEHQESNVWGYKSGTKAARIAWEQVAGQLTRAMDLVLRTVRDGET